MKKSVLGYEKNLGKIVNGEKDMNIVLLDSGQLYCVKDSNSKVREGLLSYHLDVDGCIGEFIFE